MKKSAVIFLLLLGGSFAVFAQQNEYRSLMERVKKGDQTVDFRAFRLAFAEMTPVEQRVADMKTQTQMANLLNEKKFKEVVKFADEIHKNNFVDLNSHIFASMAYQGLSDAKKAKFHESVYLGLVNSILKDADGNGPKTAYRVISIAEAFILLNALELKRGTQTVENIDGVAYQVVSATDPKTNEVSKVYFVVEKPIVALSPVPNE